MTTSESQEFRDTLAADILCTPKEDRPTMLTIAKESEEYQEAKKEKVEERQNKKGLWNPSGEG